MKNVLFIFYFLKICAIKNKVSSNQPVFKVASKCLKFCLENRYANLFRLEACFVTCYEQNLVSTS